MAKAILRVLCVLALLIPPLFIATAVELQAGEQGTTAQNTQAPATAGAPTTTTAPTSPAPQRSVFDPSDEGVNPMPSLWGAPGLWKTMGAKGLPAGSFGGGGWMERFSRSPGQLRITSIGVSGFVSLHRRFMLDMQYTIHRRILVRRADELSLGQDDLRLRGKGGCSPGDPQQPPCFPSNLFYQIRTPPTSLVPLVPSSSLSALRDVHTGLLFPNFAGYNHEFPWAGRANQDGRGELNVGLRITAKDFEGDSGVALAFRPHISIPTRTGGNELLLRGVQTGSLKYGFDVLLEGHGGRAAGVYFNTGYTHVTNPNNFTRVGITDDRLADLDSQVPLRFGINIPRTSRVQLVAEYDHVFYVGDATANLYARDWSSDGTIGLRLFPKPWFSIGAAYRNSLATAGDKHGFVFQLAATHIPTAYVAPVPPTVTCSADRTSVRPGEPVTLTATASTTTGGTLSYTWTTTGGRIEGSGPTARLDTTGLAPGTYSVTVRVDDGRGGFADCTVQVSVVEPPPPPKPQAPTVSCSADRTSVMAGEAVTVTATASSPDNRSLNYDWTATGGRIQGSGPSVRWDTTGLQPGTYTATVRVTDDRGLSADCSVTITIQAPPARPRASRLGECGGSRAEGQFDRNSARVNNQCKGKLDDAALRLRNEPDSRLAIIGSKEARERAATLAAQRASNAKAYIVQQHQVAGDRIEVRTGPDGDRKVEMWLIPRGADTADVPGSPAQEITPRAPARKRAAKKAATTTQ